MVGYDDDQCAFGCAAFQERELGVDMFECGRPVFGIPPVIVADFVGVTDVQVGQAGVREARAAASTRSRGVTLP